TSGEDWKNVLVGVGSSSALSFRYDLWSVRQVQREMLANEEKFAIAPPTGVSPYGKDKAGDAGGEVLLSEFGDDEIRRPAGHPGDSAANRVGAKEADAGPPEPLPARATAALDAPRPSPAPSSAFGKSGGGGRGLRREPEKMRRPRVAAAEAPPPDARVADGDR